MNRLAVTALVLIFFKGCQADGRTVNWTRVTGSGLERRYQLPALIAMTTQSCDLEEEVCDIGCCSDSDCTSAQKAAFHCSKPTNSKPALELATNQLLWLHVDAENAPFRGRFHGDRRKLTTWPQLAELPLAPPLEGVSRGLRWGVAVPGLRLPSNGLLGGLCVDADVRFLRDRESACSRQISAELCNANLGAQRYLGLATEARLLCVTKTSSGRQASDACAFDTSSVPTPTLDVAMTMCRHVVVEVRLELVWNASSVVMVTAELSLADVPIATGNVNKVNKVDKVDKSKALKPLVRFYVTQHFTVRFRHVTMATPSNESAQALPRIGRGYALGSPLIGWREGSTNETLRRAKVAVWTNGHLGCRDTTPVTFGNDVITTCVLWVHDEEVEDCEGLRRRVLDLQLGLTTATLVQSSSSPTTPSSTVDASTLIGRFAPVTRVDDHGLLAPGCRLPTALSLHVMYTAGPRRSHSNVVAIRSSLSNETWLVTSPRIVLTSSVSFVLVRAHQERPVSRFWLRVRDPDQSETAWLNVWHVLDDVTTGEEKAHVTTAVLVLAGCIFVAVMLVARCRP